jgi:hypothetical protein
VQGEEEELSCWALKKSGWRFNVDGELLILLLLLFVSVTSHELRSGSSAVGEGGTTIHRVVTFTLPLARFLTSHKSVSFFFIVGTLSTVETVGSDESFDLLDCILEDFIMTFFGMKFVCVFSSLIFD